MDSSVRLAERNEHRRPLNENIGFHGYKMLIRWQSATLSGVGRTVLDRWCGNKPSTCP